MRRIAIIAVFGLLVPSCAQTEGDAAHQADDEQVARSQQFLFTNAGTLTHHRDYVEPDETGEHPEACKEEPRSSYLAVRVDTL